METYTKKQRLTLSAGVVVVTMYTAYTVFIVFFTEHWPADHLTQFYHLVIVLLSVTFVERENRQFHNLYHPHELGMFVWFFWPIYFPYYMVKTRGAVGFFLFVGMIAILMIQTVVIIAWNILVDHAT